MIRLCLGSVDYFPQTPDKHKNKELPTSSPATLSQARNEAEAHSSSGNGGADVASNEASGDASSMSRSVIGAGISSPSTPRGSNYSTSSGVALGGVMDPIHLALKKHKKSGSGVTTPSTTAAGSPTLDHPQHVDTDLASDSSTSSGIATAAISNNNNNNNNSNFDSDGTVNAISNSNINSSTVSPTTPLHLSFPPTPTAGAQHPLSSLPSSTSYPQQSPHSVVLKSGWLKMRGSLNVWWNRWAVVKSDGHLLYFRTEKVDLTVSLRSP
jgi:hypothetical protein